VRNTAGVDDNDVRFFAKGSGGKAGVFKQLTYLLAFVLVDFAAERCNAKSF
jgi:hypothetical protein